MYEAPFRVLMTSKPRDAPITMAGAPSRRWALVMRRKELRDVRCVHADRTRWIVTGDCIVWAARVWPAGAAWLRGGGYLSTERTVLRHFHSSSSARPELGKPSLG